MPTQTKNTIETIAGPEVTVRVAARATRRRWPASRSSTRPS